MSGVLVIYNTLTRKKEVFEPVDPPFVKIYHCGITPYSESHVGHLRSEVAVDTLRRTLRFLGYIDIAISNFTDIDDKIIKKAKETDMRWDEIPEKYIKYHLEVIKEVGNLPFYINPKVTEHIGDIVEFVGDLIKKDYAYKGEKGIYFKVDKFKDYGKLSRRKNPEAWGQELDILEDKIKPYDFALWKFKKPGEPYWETEIGEGRPGWHIECSTMSSKYLGIQFDIHSGGQDLIFPHHENEIAQSEARFRVKPWVRYWFHIGYVMIDGEKMSKSLGNIIPAKEFVNKIGAMPARFYLISTHYREPLNIKDSSIMQAKENYRYITSTIKTIVTALDSLDRTYYLNRSEIILWRNLLEYHKRFVDAILNDIDTTTATSVLLEATRFINREIIPSEKFTLVYSAYEFYNIVNNIYACWNDVIYGNSKGTLHTKLTNKLIELLIEIRKELRKQKNYELADRIRNTLRELGINLLDKGWKTEWRFI